MFVPRVASSRFICKACRQASSPPVLAVNGLSSRTPHKPSITLTRASRCASSTSVPQGVEKHDLSADDPDFAFLEDTTKPAATVTNAQELPPTPIEPLTEPAPAERTPPTQAASIPWYLRQQASIPAQAQKPAEVPDLPTNPPPLLASLLEYVSITAGLDDLHLLDLRHLDPPPALGPKLIMLIATARSEKHLHVAADRFCRWLRREHGLKANAAGLLGRNELKIKLRRKAKRMRMLANVGGTMPEGNIDDGIRTGWICCTIGKIEAHPDDMHMPGDDVQEFVGFRDIKPGVNVVVQMFTEDKRAETDLETLWGGVLRTHQRNNTSADEALRELEQDIRELDEEAESDENAENTVREERHSAKAASTSPARGLSSTAASTRRFHRPRPSPGDFFPPASNSIATGQLRRLHTVGLR